MNILKTLFWHKINLFLIIFGVYSCTQSSEKKSCYIIKRHDSLLVKNEIRTLNYLIATDIPKLVNGYSNFKDGSNNFYIYLTNRFYLYSINENKITSTYMFKGDNLTIFDDTVIIQRTNDRIYLNSTAHHFVFKNNLLEYYDLDNLIADSLKANIINYTSDLKNNLLFCQFNLRNNKTFSFKLNIDTINLKKR